MNYTLFTASYERREGETAEDFHKRIEDDWRLYNRAMEICPIAILKQARCESNP